MKKRRIDRTILRGDRVRYTDAFLKSTGQFYGLEIGPQPPCHWGYHARGVVIFRANGSALCQVLWDDGHETDTLARYLERVPTDQKKGG